MRQSLVFSLQRADPYRVLNCCTGITAKDDDRCASDAAYRQGIAVGMIQGKVPREHSTTLLPVARLIEVARTILIVEASDALPLLRPQPGRQSVVLTQMRMLGQQMLDNVQPDAIIAPLIATDWDIVDLGITLQDMGYCGDLYALTRPLPRAELVLREVGAICPRLTVRLLELS